MDPQQPARADAQSLDQLALLYSMVDHIQRARRVEHVYQEVAEGARQVLAVERSALLVQDGREGMRVKAWGGLSVDARRALEGYSPWSREDRDPRPVVVPDLTTETGPVYEALRREGIRTAVWIPLLHRGRLMGELLLGSTRSRSFLPAELRLAEVIAGHVAFSIWRARSDQDQAELLQRFEAERSVLESVVNQMPAGVLLADAPSGRIITSNPQVAAIWGKTLRHAARVTDYGMWGGRDDDGQPLDPHCWPLARSVEHGETVSGEEIRIERADGTEAIVRMSSAPVLDSRGRQLAAVATVFDVTGEREEERRKAFLEEATQRLNVSIELEQTLATIARLGIGPHGDWCLLFRSREDGSLECAAAFQRTAGEARDLPGFRGRVLRADADHPVRRALDERHPLLLEEGRDPGDELEAGPEGGSEPEPDASSMLVLPLVAREQPLGSLMVGRARGAFDQADLALMTELARRASLALENALLYERARAADRAKSSFLAVMSHEFRTPLSAILGYADILTAQVHGDLTPKQRTHLDRVKASVRHLSHLVDEILSFASMEAGRERVVRRRTDVRALVVDVLDIMEPIAEAAGLSLDARLPDAPIPMATDPSKVRQILINLVSNALKYTPAGGVSVRLESDGAMTRCVVSDTGPGIAAEHLERVFEPFWQVDQSDGGRVTGTGLGLAVARRLARLLGGDLILESEVGSGSTFTLTLPLDETGVAADPPA